MTGLVGLRTLAAVPSRLAYSVASRLGRAFDSICLHHERVYCEGQGPDCFDPDGIHTAVKDYSSLWLVPRRFALACRGNPVLRPGQTICLKCLDSIREKHPDVNSFYLADRAETQRKLARKKDPSVASEQHDGLDPYDSSAKESTDAAAKEEDAESSSATEDVDGVGRRQRRRNFMTSDRQLRNLRVENPEFSEVLGQLDVKSKLREKRKVTKNISPLVASQGGRGSRHYTSRGLHIVSNSDSCDCLMVGCPGCHFPCPKCGSAKCGDECRSNRSYVYEHLELDGHNGLIQNPLLG
uniref:ARF7 effector protein C-terminal domain-containing protein n=1 Tax=Ixodes ricinus TaxID=34613 RepID=V5GER0_IXORI